MKKILALAILFPLLYSSQIGINNANPSSTLAVSGSIEGNYREITATDVLTKNDYHVSFAGSTSSILVLPTMSTTDNTESDFRGRKYYLKNNSSASNLTLTAVSGQTIRVGGSIAATDNYILVPGMSAILTANGTNGWDMDIVAGALPDTSWKLSDNAFNGTLNLAQYIAQNGTYQTLNGSMVTVTVPSGYAQSRVVLNFNGWGDVSTAGAAMGSLRFQIVQTGTSSATYASTTMSSWATIIDGVTVRFNFPAAYSISNLPPGTYTFSLQVLREDEWGHAPIGNLTIWGMQSKVEVYNRH